jgi:hypothetical protein
LEEHKLRIAERCPKENIGIPEREKMQKGVEGAY